MDDGFPAKGVDTVVYWSPKGRETNLIILPTLHPRGIAGDRLRLVLGLHYQEEKQLWNLYLLKKDLPKKIIFVTSNPVSQEVLEYYFRVLLRTGKYGSWPNIINALTC